MYPVVAALKRIEAVETTRFSMVTSVWGFPDGTIPGQYRLSGGMALSSAGGPRQGQTEVILSRLFGVLFLSKLCLLLFSG